MRIFIVLSALLRFGCSVESKTSCEVPTAANGHGAAMSQIRSRLQEQARTLEQNANASKTVTSSSYSRSETKGLGDEAETNLTAQVHEQARVVANSAGRLLHITEEGNRTEEVLREKYKTMNAAANSAQLKSAALATDLDKKRAEEKRLRDATQAAEQELWKLQKKYLEAKKAYEDAQADASAAEKDAAQKTSARDLYQRTMNGTVTEISTETNELQDNIDKLNDLNEDLKTMQAKNAACSRHLAAVVACLSVSILGA